MIFIKEAWANKSISRTCMNLKIAKEVELTGRVIDLGGGSAPSYYRFLGYNSPPLQVILLDILPAHHPHIIATLEGDIPVKDLCIQTVLMFNVLEHIYDHDRLLRQVYRVLDWGGKFYLWVPYLAAIHGDPQDYFRYSETALEHMLRGAGFIKIEIIPCSGLCLAVADLLRPIVPTRLLRTGLTTGALMGDWISRHLMPTANSKYVLGYFCTAVKTHPEQ
jgi:SAM-dependent methyltransferase